MKHTVPLNVLKGYKELCFLLLGRGWQKHPTVSPRALCRHSAKKFKTLLRPKNDQHQFSPLQYQYTIKRKGYENQ